MASNALPTLYKRTSSGATQSWRIWTEGNKVITEYGQVDGKLQRATEVVEGKNIGRANETTAEEQAERQAQSEWETKKARKGYSENRASAESGKNDGAGGIRPMLAQPFTKHGDKLRYPLYVQPKLDGIRCIAIVESDGVRLWSREQKQIVAVPHIAETIADLKLPVGTVLDGELYNHELRSDFEKIVSVVRQQKPVSAREAELIMYHIYDIPRGCQTKATFGDRLKALQLLERRAAEHPMLVIVPTMLIPTEDALITALETFLAHGYEGAIARGAQALYEEGKRSYQLQKLKKFDDAEFAIIGVEEGVGNMAGCAVFVCTLNGKTDDASIFNAKMDGALDKLRPYLTNRKLWEGKKLTVQYQGFTKKGKPRFPVGKAVRDYE